MSIAERLQDVRAQVRDACAKAGRPVDSVQLLAVSKGHPASSIREAYAAGQRAFGENYAQELRDKAEDLKDLTDLQWHFLGPVQTNKVKYLAPRIVMLHTLDRLELAEALSAKIDRTVDALIEVNIGREPQKHGVMPEEVAVLVEKVGRVKNIRVRGLMCIPPAEDAEGARPHFKALGELGRKLGLGVLSMGMSGDFAVAIAEGSSIIRVGTAIFGARPRRAPAGGA